MAIKFSQFNLRTDHTSGMYLVGYDGNQNIHITVDNLFDDFINGTENTIAMFGTNGTVLADSIITQSGSSIGVAGAMTVTSDATFSTNIEVEGTADFNGDVNLGDEAGDLITQNGTLYLNGPVKDTTDTLGAVDQVLLSDATGELTFTDLADLHVGGAEVVEVPVKNVQGSALVKGDPVYISGSVGASGRLEVQLADASNTLKMPAVGLLKQDLADQAEGFAVVTGKLRNLITDPIDGVTPTENDVIYVKPSGTSGAALTTTKPVYGNFIQNIGKVGRVSTAADGNLVVSSILRTNDIPNLTPGRLWIGSTGNTIESQTLFVDEANGRLGIGTSSPGEKLHVVGKVRVVSETSTVPVISITDINNAFQAGLNSSGNLALRATSGMYFYTGGSNTRMTITNTGDVGIGTTSPSNAVHVVGNGIRIVSTATNANNGEILLGTAGNNNRPQIQMGPSSDPDQFRISNAGYWAIGTYSNSDLRFNVNSTTAMHIESTNQYVGIGTTSPGSTLTVRNSGSGNSPFKIEDSGGVVLMNVNEDSSGNAEVRLNNSSGTQTVRLDTSGSSYFTGGNFGIGTNLPGKNLHVYDSSGGATLKIESNTANAYDSSKIELIGGNLSTGEIIFGDPTDSDVGKIIYRHDGNSLAFNVNAGEKMRIDSSGYVGINTTSPGANLDVNGQIRLTSAGQELQFANHNVGAYRDANNRLVLAGYNGIDFNAESTASGMDAQTRRMRITANGQIQFNEYGSGAFTGTAAKTLSVDANGNVIETTNTSIDGSGTANYVTKWLDADTITDSVIYDDGTNVGIGTTSPVSPLHVDSSGVTTLRISTSSSSSEPQIILIDGANDYFAIQKVDRGVTFKPQGTEKMRIDSDGKVGIGTSSPTQKLTLEDGQFHHTLSGNVMNKFAIGFNGVNYNGQLEMFQGTTSKVYITANGNSYFNGGNVGIGTTSPASKLDVNGGIRMADDSSTASASNVGTLRYRTSGNNSYVDMCMQTGASTYAWVNIVQNNW